MDKYMNLTDLSIIKLCNTIENQNFDRKSAKIEASKIATLMIAFANADGGLIAVGIEDNGTITGIDDFISNINEIIISGKPVISKCSNIFAIHAVIIIPMLLFLNKAINCAATNININILPILEKFLLVFSINSLSFLIDLLPIP